MKTAVIKLLLVLITTTALGQEKLTGFRMFGGFTTIPGLRSEYNGSPTSLVTLQALSVENSSLQLSFISAKDITAVLTYNNYHYNNGYPLTYQGETIYNTPLTDLNEFSLQAGKKFNLWQEYITATATGGLSVLNVISPANVLRKQVCTQGIFGSYCYYYFDYNNKRSIHPGLNARLSINLNITRWVGLTLGANYSLNNTRSYGGFNIGLIAGYLRSKQAKAGSQSN